MRFQEDLSAPSVGEHAITRQEANNQQQKYVCFQKEKTTDSLKMPKYDL